MEKTITWTYEKKTLLPGPIKTILLPGPIKSYYLDLPSLAWLQQPQSYNPSREGNPLQSVIRAAIRNP